VLCDIKATIINIIKLI